MLSGCNSIFPQVVVTNVCGITIFIVCNTIFQQLCEKWYLIRACLSYIYVTFYYNDRQNVSQHMYIFCEITYGCQSNDILISVKWLVFTIASVISTHFVHFFLQWAFRVKLCLNLASCARFSKFKNQQN